MSAAVHDPIRQPSTRAAVRTTLTVAICTRDRPQQLERLLQSLTRQTRMPDALLVVDNAPSSDATENLVHRQFPEFRYVREPVPGLDFARNRALREADTDVVAYIDDDAVAAADWSEAIRGVFDESPRIGICNGKVDALALDSAGQRLFEANGGFGRGDQRIRVPPAAGARRAGWPRPLVAWSLAVGSGVSMAVRRDVAVGLGGFDDALDLGAALPGGGDLDMLWRVLEAGYDVVYEPRVRAWHEHRRALDAAEMQILEHNRALIATLTKFVRVAPGSRKLPVVAFLLWRLVKPFVRLLRRAVGRDPLPAPLLCRLVIHTWRGLVAYPAAVELARSRRAEFLQRT
jgi:GT2 family glycosyltransferase